MLPRGSWPVLLCALLAAPAGGSPASLPLTEVLKGGRKAYTLVGTDEGLASGAVVCMAQDTQGFLWMGSENGLMRYEGASSRLYGTEDGLPSAMVGRLLADPDSGIWAATLRGLVLFRDGAFRPIEVEGKPYLGNPGHLALDRRGRVWIHTADGLLRQKAGLVFERVGWRAPAAVYDLATGSVTGRVYVASQAGIHGIEEDGRHLDWGPAEGLPPEGPMTVVEDGQGRLWAGSGRTLARLDRGAARFAPASEHLPAPISPNGHAYVDRDGTVWMPTQNGAQQLGGERLDAAHGLPFRWVRGLFRDREGSLWVMGTGLAHLKGHGRIVTLGAGGEVVWAMLRDAQGHMLEATDNGVLRIGPDRAVPLPGTEGWRIKGLALDAEGTLWMVNTRGPTLWLRRGAAAAVQAPLGEAGTGCNSVHVDPSGQVWLGHIHKGLLRWDPRARRLVQEAPPAGPGAQATAAFEIHGDAQGRLWVGTDTGLLLREASGAWRFYREPSGLRVRGMAILPDGTAWVHGDEPKGLARVRLADGGLEVLERRTRGQGLSSNMVYAVRLDGAGHVWVATDKGLDRLDPPLHLGRPEGLASEDCSVSALRAEGQVLWVGTSAGLSAVDAAALPEPPPPPQAHILQVAFGGRRLEPPFGALGAIPSDQASVAFRVAAPAYANPQALRFQVRLLGLEAAWRDLDGRQVHFPALPGRSYRFEVRAALGAGPFGPPATLAFKVLPPWWRTGWAYGAAFAAGCGLLYGVVLLRLRALARSKAALEALVAARTRELSERNQELSEALGNVKQLSGLLPICAHCKKIRDDQGYWNQLELYLSQHAEVGFSHGICPECASLHYPAFRKKG